MNSKVSIKYIIILPSTDQIFILQINCIFRTTCCYQNKWPNLAFSNSFLSHTALPCESPLCMEQGEAGEAGNDENCFNADTFTLTRNLINRKALLGEGWDCCFHGANGPVMLIHRASVVHLQEISHQNALKSHSLRSSEGRTWLTT